MRIFRRKIIVCLVLLFLSVKFDIEAQTLAAEFCCFILYASASSHSIHLESKSLWSVRAGNDLQITDCLSSYVYLILAFSHACTLRLLHLSTGVQKQQCLKVWVNKRACVFISPAPSHCRTWDISSQKRHLGGFFRRAGGTPRIPSCARTNLSLSSLRCGVCRHVWSSLCTRWDVAR